MPGKVQPAPGPVNHAQPHEVIAVRPPSERPSQAEIDGKDGETRDQAEQDRRLRKLKLRRSDQERDRRPARVYGKEGDDHDHQVDASGQAAPDQTRWLALVGSRRWWDRGVGRHHGFGRVDGSFTPDRRLPHPGWELPVECRYVGSRCPGRATPSMSEDSLKRVVHGLVSLDAVHAHAAHRL